MYVVLGATGHVGRAVANELLDAGLPVTAVVRKVERAFDLASRGATVIEVDVRDVEALRRAFRSGKRAFLLNPPADVSGDTDVEERETVRCILAALDGSGLERAVAQSVYGAQPGQGIGDLTVLHDLEEGLRSQSIPAVVIRAAYYMSNWDSALAPAKSGTLPTMFPVELAIPMVAPADVGRLAARLLLENGSTDHPVHVEGPERYSSADVAGAFSKALGEDIVAAATPRYDWENAFRGLGFSIAAARSYARMTAVTVDGSFEGLKPDRRGGTTLDAYVRDLVARDSAEQPA